jgi:phage tail sheath protein FI
VNSYDAARDEWKFDKPGVYLQEGFSLPRRDPFTTGVPVFIGRCRTTRDEEVGKLQQLTLWSQFPQYVGKTYHDCVLGYAVRGFFQNGGSRCYVIVVRDVTASSLMAALDNAARLHSIDLVCVPDLGERRAMGIELQQMIVAHCQEAGDRFAILDSWRNDEPRQVSQVWSSIDGINGALYYPWIHVRNFEEQLSAERRVLVPPCGHVAGVYARTDQSRGVHKAPANEVLEGVLSQERHVTHVGHDTDHTPTRINCIRSFPGRGIRVWGARTLSGNDAWTYVNVRRIFLTAIRWLEWQMRSVVFEPNDARLWAQIESDLHQYFMGLYRQGALQGATAEQAYYVRCNARTNPRESIEAGRVVAEVGLAATVPFEFVVVRLIYGASGVSISGPTRPEQNT